MKPKIHKPELIKEIDDLGKPQKKPEMNKTGKCAIDILQLLNDNKSTFEQGVLALEIVKSRLITALEYQLMNVPKPIVEEGEGNKIPKKN